jgi:serine/threonine protein kinase
VQETTRLDHYEFIALLGKGTFGRALLCQEHSDSGDIPAGSMCVLKESETTASARHEVELLKKLNSPAVSHDGQKYIVGLYDAFEEDVAGSLLTYIVLEHCQCDLAKAISQRKLLLQRGYRSARFSEADICDVLQQLLQALAFIHSIRIIHCDIKPGNGNAV